MRRRVAVAVVAWLALGAAPARGQRLTATAAVVLAEHRVDIGAGVEQSRGALFSAGMRVVVAPRWSTGLEGTAGSLKADRGGPDRDVGQLRAVVGFHATSWLTLEAAVGTRTYTAPIARQRWTGAALGLEARLPFASGRIEGLGRIALQPVLTVSDLEVANPGVLAGAGVRYRGRHGSAALTYWIERYDFTPAAGATRRERLSGLQVRATWSPRREP